jgi:tetratricopeptide (TPR) repeat protein
MLKSFAPAAAILALALGGFSVSSLAADAGSKETVSKAANKQLKAAQEACTAKNYALCAAKANEALAAPGKTAYDTYVSNQMLAFAYARQGNNAAAANALEAQLATGKVPAGEQAGIIKSLASVAYQQKNYAKSIELGNRLIRNGGADADTYTLVGQGYYLQGKYGEAAKFIGGYVGDVERRGSTPKEQTLILLRSAQEKANNTVGATDALEKLVTHYPKSDYWNNLLYTLRNMEGMSDKHTLNVYRLMQATQTMRQASDYFEMAELAVSAGNSAEAQKVLEAGNAATIFTEQRAKDRATRLMTAAQKAATADRVALPKLEKEAATAKTGDVDVAVGSGYLGHGDNAKAIEALTRGVTKGSLKNGAEAQILLGIAQLRANNKAEALRAFRGVKSDDAIFQRIAKLWALYAS